MNTTKTIGRDLPNGDYIEIEAEERDGSDGLSPGFTITLLGWSKNSTWSGRVAKRAGRGADFAGSDHATIGKVAPELAPLILAHLAGRDGTPMHALANGWYFYSGASAIYEREHYGPTYVERMGTDHDRAAHALHIHPRALPIGLDRDGFTDFVAGLAKVWQTQADEARAALAAMVDGEGVE